MSKRGWVSGWVALGALALACSGKYSSNESGGVQHQAVDCAEHVACDLDTPCSSGSCISINGCSSALCVDTTSVCQEACAATDCAVLDSYPGQLPRCPDGTAIQGNGKPPIRSSAASGSGGSTPSSMGTGTGTIPGNGGAAVSQGGSGPTGGSYSTGGTPGAAGTAGSTKPILYELIKGEPIVYCPQFQRCGPGAQAQCQVSGNECVALPGCDSGICAPTSALCAELCTGECTILESYPGQVSCSSTKIWGTEVWATAGAGGEAG